MYIKLLLKTSNGELVHTNIRMMQYIFRPLDQLKYFIYEQFACNNNLVVIVLKLVVGMQYEVRKS
jgi:hypothetical protein